MPTTTRDQIDQLRSLKRKLLTALRVREGFRSVQDLTRKAFNHKLITNETQQAILEACQPLHFGLGDDPDTSKQMVSQIEILIQTEINTKRRELANAADV